jgi:hypothetical protein
MREFNARCDPLWSEKELEHKLDSAGKVTRHSKPRGHLLGERGPLASAKAEPAVTTFNIDTSEPLPPEQWRRLPKGNSEKGVPSVPTNDPPNEKSEKGVAGVPGQLAEAQRIAGELVKLYHVGAISGPDDLEAVFYAHVIGAFGGAVLKNSPGQTLSAGEHPEPVDTVPEPPPGLSPQERMEFYTDDLAATIGEEYIDHDYQPPVFHARTSSPEKETVKKRPPSPPETDILFASAPRP